MLLKDFRIFSVAARGGGGEQLSVISEATVIWIGI
jgi:hypothetical protein